MTSKGRGEPGNSDGSTYYMLYHALVPFTHVDVALLLTGTHLFLILHDNEQTD